MLRSQSVLLGAFGLMLLGGPVLAQSDFPVSAAQTANIQSNGPKQGATADRYFNVEGKSHDKYSDYGVLRFETKTLKADMEKKLGAGKYKITGVKLHLPQSNAPFTKEGSVEFYFSPDEKTDIKAATGPLKYPYDPKGKSLAGTLLGKGVFTKVDAKAAPTATLLTDYDLMKNQPGQKDLLAALAQGKTITLIVAEADAGVAATWSAKAITLVVKAAPK